MTANTRDRMRRVGLWSALALTAATLLSWAPPAGAYLAAAGGWGAQGSGPGQFAGIRGITVDSRGYVYVTDPGRIQRFDAMGHFVQQWSAPPVGASTFDPWGIASDPAGFIYVTEQSAHRVDKFTSTGQLLARWGRNGGDGTQGTGDGDFAYPTGIASDQNGNIFVSDFNAIRAFSFAGALLKRWPALGGTLALDRFGNSYQAGNASLQVSRFDPTGRLTVRWGYPGYGPGQFGDYGPQGLAVDRDGNVWVADPFDGRVEQFTSGGGFLSACGPRTDPGFSNPSSVAMAPDGALYVGDAFDIKRLAHASSPAAICDDTPVSLFRIALKPTTFRSSPTRNSRRRGSLLSYQVSVPARLLLTVRLLSHAMTQTSSRVVGTIHLRGSTGRNVFRFTGWIGAKRLRAGRYRFDIRATDSAGYRSRRASIAFRIIGR